MRYGPEGLSSKIAIKSLNWSKETGIVAAVDWIQKEARCMGATRLDAKKHFCPYGCMRIASESQQNRPVFEADGDWR